MSSNIVFRIPGRNTNYMPIDVNSSKEQILEIYARQSFSTNPENTWPYASPLAGYYDIKNSDTKLILLNNKRTYSHLRGKTSAKRESLGKDKFYDWVEREYENKKLQEQEGYQKRTESTKSKRVADPDRHFTHLGCTFRPVDPDRQSLNSANRTVRTGNPSATSSAQSRYRATKPHINVTLGKNSKMTKEEEQELIDYLISIGKRTTGLQDKTFLTRAPSEFRSSYNLNHPDLNFGQKLYMNSLCNVYSIKDLKESRKNKYLSILEKQKAVDKHRKNRYKLHPWDDFESYQSFISQKRPVPNQINCGYIDPRKPPVKSAVEKKRIYNEMYASESAISFTGRNSRIRTEKDGMNEKQTNNGQMTPALIEQYIESKKQSSNNDETTSLSSASSINLNNDNQNLKHERSTEYIDTKKSSGKSSKLSSSSSSSSSSSQINDNHKRSKSQTSKPTSARSNTSSISSTSKSSLQSNSSNKNSLRKQELKELSSPESKGSRHRVHEDVSSTSLSSRSRSISSTSKQSQSSSKSSRSSSNHENNNKDKTDSNSEHDNSKNDQNTARSDRSSLSSSSSSSSSSKHSRSSKSKNKNKDLYSSSTSTLSKSSKD